MFNTFSDFNMKNNFGYTTPSPTMQAGQDCPQNLHDECFTHVRFDLTNNLVNNEKFVLTQ